MSYDLKKAQQILPQKKISEDATMVPVTQVSAANAENGMQALLDCVDENIKKFTDVFYIEVLTREDMPGVWRWQYMPHRQCPSPIPDHSIFKYSIKEGKLDLLWSLPPLEWCEYLARNADQVDKEEWHLLSFVLQYYSGKLMQLAKQLNGERADSVALEKGSKLEGAQKVIFSPKDVE